MPDPQRLTLLTDLRQAAGLSLSAMARACGLAGNQSHQTAGAWELGRMIPTVRRRAPFIRYLWDRLALRQQPAQFETIWEVLVEEWNWDPISDREWRTLTHQPRPGSSTLTDRTPIDQSTTDPRGLSLSKSAPFQAPALTPHFVGRTAEVSQIEALLANPAGPRLVALVGMGGIGKTTLATSLAHRLRPHFPDGVLWARVATAHPLDILQSWAQAYGYDFSGLSDVESRAAAVRNLLAQKAAVLVLDDVRLAVAAQVLLPNTTNCAVLITTRSQEVAAALHATPVALGELSAAAALALLTSLLGGARVQAEPVEAEVIGELLYYLPLALEIAAQRLAARPQQPLASLRQHLQDASARLNQLTISDRAVRAAFLVSWEQMTAALQRVFALLGLFAGRSFPVAALAAVADLPPDVAQDHLWSLQALSLVKAEGSTRYRQHPLLADFAREQLGDDAPAATRLTDYYLHFARQHQTDYQALEPEWENLMAAMAGAYARQQWQTVIDYAEVLTEPWLTQARYTQARQGYGWAVAGAPAQNVPMTLANCLVKWGYACSEQGDLLEAKQLLGAGLDVAQQNGDFACVADAQFHLARFAADQGVYEEADQLLKGCLELRQQLQDAGGIAAVYSKQADLFYRVRALDRATELAQAALAVQEVHNDIPGILNTLRLLSDIANAQENFHEAQRLAQRSLALAQQHHLRSELAETYLTLAAIARCLQQFAPAWAYAEQARQHFEHMGNRAFLAVTLYEECIILRLTDRLTEALQTGQSSLTLLLALNDEFNRIYCLHQLGLVYQQMQQYHEAERLWQEGYTLALAIHHPYVEKLQQVLQ